MIAWQLFFLWYGVLAWFRGLQTPEQVLSTVILVAGFGAFLRTLVELFGRNITIDERGIEISEYGMSRHEGFWTLDEIVHVEYVAASNSEHLVRLVVRGTSTARLIELVVDQENVRKVKALIHVQGSTKGHDPAHGGLD